MIAEYERAQIAERTRRGKAHRARTGTINVLSGAPFGYRYIRRGEHTAPLRDPRTRGSHRRRSVPPLRAREQHDRRPDPLAHRPQTTTRTGKQRWDRSTVWAMLRNPAYAGRAAFGKTMRRATTARPEPRSPPAGPHHPTPPQVATAPARSGSRSRSRPGHRGNLRRGPQRRLADNERFAPRNANSPPSCKSLASCATCGYAYYRTSTAPPTRRSATTAAWARTTTATSTGGSAPTPGARRLPRHVVWDHITGLLADPS